MYVNIHTIDMYMYPPPAHTPAFPIPCHSRFTLHISYLLRPFHKTSP